MKNDLILFNSNVLDKLWEETTDMFDDDFFKIPFSYSTNTSKILNGRCDFEEVDNKYLLSMELPGVKKDEVNIIIKNDIITISWSRKKEKNNSKKVKCEINEGSFSRSFSIPDVNSSTVKAELKDGILKIELEKKEEAKDKIIKIN